MWPGVLLLVGLTAFGIYAGRDQPGRVPRWWLPIGAAVTVGALVLIFSGPSGDANIGGGFVLAGGLFTLGYGAGGRLPHR